WYTLLKRKQLPQRAVACIEKRVFMLKHKKSGFTIVELLIVVVVIAVLATITVVAYTNLQERARTSAADSTLTQAAKKLALYKAEQESYPASLDDAGIDSDETIALDYSASSGG